MVRDKNKQEKQRVRIGSTLSGSKSATSLVLSPQMSRFSFYEYYSAALKEALQLRNMFQIMDTRGSTVEDVTPVLLEDDTGALGEKLVQLYRKINNVELKAPTSHLRPMQKLGINMRTSLEDVAKQVTMSQAETAIERDDDNEDSEEEMERASGMEPASHVLPFIKIVLRRTKEQLFYEQRSTTVLRNTEEAREVEEDNKLYDYFTVGKGRVRRTNESEAQTTGVLYKSRDANTQCISTAAVVSYVSNFEMFDTYRNLETTTTSLAVGDEQKVEVITYKVGGVDQFEEISKTRDFKLALMVTLRILAGNAFEQEQRRFRNMILPDPLAKTRVFTYALKELFCFEPQTQSRRAVADIAFCPGNGDIIAVAYGLFACISPSIPETGYLCIWNIKNPVNPERIFHYNMPVVTVQFSPSQPQLLAVGLFDGSVEVLDITNFDDPPIALTQRAEDSTCDPVTAVEWLPQGASRNTEAVELEPFLALSQDGSVVKYRIINSPYMLAFLQIQLDRVEGSPEGLPVQRTWMQAQSNRFPQGINMILHPRQHDIYYVLTDEGCIHKCSTNYPHQHLEVLQVHKGGVNVMDFSPWSPKLFLTAGNDWCIRIWMEGIFEPLITLKNESCPIQMAAWSRTHSTIIVSCTRKVISLWDIRRSVLKPVSITKIDRSLYTLFRFSRCGRSIAMGNERGNIMIMGFEDMPFPPHYQYDELELAIYRAISVKPELTTELKSIGFFGYVEHKRSRKHHCAF